MFYFIVFQNSRISGYSNNVQNSGRNFSLQQAQQAFSNWQIAHITTERRYAWILIRCSSKLSCLLPKKHTVWLLCIAIVKASIHIMLSLEGSTPSKQERKKKKRKERIKEKSCPSQQKQGEQRRYSKATQP